MLVLFVFSRIKNHEFIPIFSVSFQCERVHSTCLPFHVVAPSFLTYLLIWSVVLWVTISHLCHHSLPAQMPSSPNLGSNLGLSIPSRRCPHHLSVPAMPHFHSVDTPSHSTLWTPSSPGLGPDTPMLAVPLVNASICGF